MENLKDIQQIYENIVAETKEKTAKVQRHIFHIGTIRLLLFVAGIAGIVYFRSDGWAVIASVALLTFIPFLILVKRHNQMFYKKDYLEKKSEINEQELKAMNYDFSSFAGGNEFIDPEHFYTFDLDVFGERSIFQLINRTSTELGEKRLAEWFITHLLKKEDIEERQKAIRELASDLKFRQKFRVIGLLYKGKIADESEIIEWSKSPSYYRGKKILRRLPAMVFICNIILGVLSVIGIIGFDVWAIVFACFFFISMTFTKGIGNLQAMYGKKMTILVTYAGLIQLIERKEVQSQKLKEIKELVGNDKKAASQSVKRLSSLMNALDQRSNMIMNFVLNGLFFWELRQVMRIEAWKESCANDLPRWLEAIKQMDALCSLATFSYNNPDYTYPLVQNEHFQLEAKEMGHPLMKRSECVKNEITMTKRPFFIIITGANMAGKSTYLRTVGINHLLSCMGAPVFAAEMKIYPTKLVTSLRTTDSLNDNESYFFAELKRLKMIIDMLERGEELFIILDEILKGTNSMDKQKGSFALISQFLTLNTNGIIATHDLLLGSLAGKYPDCIRNYRFEADIVDNELSFSYSLKEGIAQNMNACFLMKKMGIAVIDHD